LLGRPASSRDCLYGHCSSVADPSTGVPRGTQNGCPNAKPCCGDFTLRCFTRPCSCISCNLCRLTLQAAMRPAEAVLCRGPGRWRARDWTSDMSLPTLAHDVLTVRRRQGSFGVLMYGLWLQVVVAPAPQAGWSKGVDKVPRPPRKMQLGRGSTQLRWRVTRGRSCGTQIFGKWIFLTSQSLLIVAVNAPRAGRAPRDARMLLRF